MIVLWVAIAIALDGAVGLIGALVPDRYLERYRPAMLGFAAGALLAAAAFDLVPQAIEARGTAAIPWLLAGVLVLVVLDRAFHHYRDASTTPFAVLGSDALHNFGDGVVIAAAFLASPRLGAITALAVIIHEVPQELADYAILRTAQVSRGRSLTALALVQLTAGLGAAATLLGAGVARITEPVQAMAAGALIYIATFGLLPGILRGATPHDRASALTGLAFGGALVALL